MSDFGPSVAETVFDDGYSAGLRGEERKSPHVDARLGPLWLAGFDTGVESREQSPVRPTEEES